MKCQNGISSWEDRMNGDLKKVDGLSQKKREPMNAVGFAAAEARYEAERKRKELEQQEQSDKSKELK